MAQTQTFPMPSGGSLTVTMAPFADSWALTKASLKTMKGLDLKSEDLSLEVGDILKTPSAVTLLVDRIVDFATSPEVESAFWKCAARALYAAPGSPEGFPGETVEPKMFDNPKYAECAREDYARIMASVLEVNCRPFLAKALSGLLKPKVEKAPESQPSK